MCSSGIVRRWPGILSASTRRLGMDIGGKMGRGKFYNYRGKTIRVIDEMRELPVWLGRMSKAETRTISGCINHILKLYFLKGEGKVYVKRSLEVVEAVPEIPTE